MLDDFVARCFPVCGTCREAGACASGPPAETTEKPSPSKDWAPNRLPVVRLKCGCIGPPWPLVVTFGVKEVICDRHGKTVILKERKGKKKKKEIPGQEDMVPF